MDRCPVTNLHRVGRHQSRWIANAEMETAKVVLTHPLLTCSYVVDDVSDVTCLRAADCSRSDCDLHAA